MMRKLMSVLVLVWACGAAGCGSEEGLPVADSASLQRLVEENAAAGKVTVIDFWATWCQPCVAMFPVLHAELHAMGEAVAPVTVSFDSQGEDEQKAVAFLEQHDAREGAYIITPNPQGQIAVVEELGEKWNNMVVPAILVFDREGRLAGEFFGGDVAPILARVREVVEADTVAPGPQANAEPHG